MKDLSAIPSTDLYAEIGRRRSAKRHAKAGRKPKLSACKFCGGMYGVQAMRAHIPICRLTAH